MPVLPSVSYTFQETMLEGYPVRLLLHCLSARATRQGCYDRNEWIFLKTLQSLSQSWHLWKHAIANLRAKRHNLKILHNMFEANMPVTIVECFGYKNSGQCKSQHIRMSDSRNESVGPFFTGLGTRTNRARAHSFGLGRARDLIRNFNVRTPEKKESRTPDRGIFKWLGRVKLGLASKIFDIQSSKK